MTDAVNEERRSCSSRALPLSRSNTPFGAGAIDSHTPTTETWLEMLRKTPGAFPLSPLFNRGTDAVQTNINAERMQVGFKTIIDVFWH